MGNELGSHCRNFGRIHNAQKRSIVRGIEIPLLPLKNQGEIVVKERPCLIVSNIDGYNGDWNGIRLQVIPIYSVPTTDFDIPIFMGKTSKICYIYTQELYSCTAGLVCPKITEVNVCPDEVFDLVQEVRMLFLKADKDSYLQARELVKAYRIEFMKVHNIDLITYPVSSNTVYELYGTGDEKISFTDHKAKGTILNKDSSSNASFRPMESSLKCTTPISDVLKNALDKANDQNKGSDSKKKPSKPSKFNSKTSTDKELIDFMRLIAVSDTIGKVSKVMNISDAGVYYRYNSVAKELTCRGLEEYIVQWSFTKYGQKPPKTIIRN